MSKTQLTQSPRSRRDRCPECGCNIILHNPETGEATCSRCGLVVREYEFDTGPEWRAFTPEEKANRSRVGGPVTILQADKGLPTVIDKTNRDAFGRRLSLQNKARMFRLRRWQSRTQYQSPMERNLLQALSELDRIVDKLHLPRNLHEEAAEIYRRALGKDMVRGRSIAAIVAACVYATSRQAGRPRLLKEIASVSRIKLKEIARCYRFLVQGLPISMPIPDPSTYVSKIAAKCDINEQIRRQAEALLKQGQEVKALTGKDPSGIAAAALYIACLLAGVKKTQKEIAEAASVTEVTVRNRYKGLRKDLGIEIHEE